MLLSFNKCSISAWTALIFLVSRVNAKGENSDLSPQLRTELHCVSPIIDRLTMYSDDTPTVLIYAFNV